MAMIGWPPGEWLPIHCGSRSTVQPGVSVGTMISE